MVSSSSNNQQHQHPNSLLVNVDMLKVKVDPDLFPIPGNRIPESVACSTSSKSPLIAQEHHHGVNNYYDHGDGDGGKESPHSVSVVLPNGLDIRPNDTPAPQINEINSLRYVNGLTNVGTTNNAPVSLPCILCNKTFKNERLAMAHEEKHHSKLARYSCGTCHGRFCYRGALNSHISTQHPQLASYDCTTCGKTFKEKSNLSAHNTIVHALNSRVFKCEFCVSAFSKKVNLNYHRKRKHPELTPTNTQGSQIMEGTNNGNGTHAHTTELPTHVTIKTEPFEGVQGPRPQLISTELSLPKVPISAAGTTNRRSVAVRDDQQMTDNSEQTGSTQPNPSSNTRAEGDFKCQFCGRAFLFRNNLKCHLRTHIRDKKYTCAICEKSFIYKESLKNHMLLHSNELPYQCDICMKKFRDRSNRRKHVKNVHKFLLAAGGSNATGFSVAATAGNGDGNPTPSTSTALPITPQPKRRKRAPAKKKTQPMTSSPSPPRGVIVSPKAISPPYASDPSNTSVKSEVMSPGRTQTQEEYSEAAQMHLHQQQQQYHLPNPSLHHANVIVYPKVKLERPDVSFSSSSPGQPNDNHQSIVSAQQRQQYYDTYEQQQQSELMASYSNLMNPPQSISPESSTRSPYEQPSSPYVINMSMLPPSRLGSNSNISNHPASSAPTHIQQHIPQQEYSNPPSLLYSSPLMSMGDGGVPGEYYWIPPVTNQNESPRPYFPPQVPIPTVTEGSLLNPQSSYTNIAHPIPPNTSQSQVPPNQQSQQQHNYFYTDLAQFDLSHL